MSSNPIFTENHLYRQREALFVKYAHKLLVQAVYDWKKPVKEEVFDEIRIFCMERHIQYESRQFLSDALEEDREYIQKLPAFQIYLEGEYEKTAYTNDVINVIKEIVSNLDKKPSKPWFRMPSFSLSLPKLTKRTTSVAPS